MQFLLVAYDGTDSKALERRINARPEHFEKIAVLKKRGEFLHGGAILDDSGKMIGSMIVYEFPDRASLDESLKNEPYVIYRVWEKIEIRPFRLANIEKEAKSNIKKMQIMKKLIIILTLVLQPIVLVSQQGSQATIPFKMEEMTSPQFVKAVDLAGGVAVIPLGIIEKHGPHLPLGTDLIDARETVFAAAKKEYAVVFPPYFVGQIFEAKHQPGTLAYSSELMWKMLQETCDELSRNGLKKIVLMNGHGGNTNFLQYFCQSQLATSKDYIVVLFEPKDDPLLAKEIESLKLAKLGGHADEDETSMMFYVRPELVDLDVIKNESGLDQGRLALMPFGYTGIWWYAKYPNHYASDVAQPNKRLGELLITSDAKQLAELIKYLKKSNTVEDLQKEFFKRAHNPMQKGESAK